MFELLTEHTLFLSLTHVGLQYTRVFMIGTRLVRVLGSSLAGMNVFEEQVSHNYYTHTMLWVCSREMIFLPSSLL